MHILSANYRFFFNLQIFQVTSTTPQLQNENFYFIVYFELFLLVHKGSNTVSPLLLLLIITSCHLGEFTLSQFLTSNPSCPSRARRVSLVTRRLVPAPPAALCLLPTAAGIFTSQIPAVHTTSPLLQEVIYSEQHLCSHQEDNSLFFFGPKPQSAAAPHTSLCMQPD